MQDSLFSEDEITFLRELVYDPAATFGCELLSGAVCWSDERFLEFIMKGGRRSHAKELFAFRTSLLVAHPREELRPAWDEVRARCPEWIGFRTERVTPAAHWPATIEDDLNAI